jgi:mycothione reductase
VSDFDLAIIGTGSGNSVLTPDFDGKRIALVEDGIFGGTCLNVGCIPTKMYVYAADIAASIRDSARYGVDSTMDSVRWLDIRDRIFGRIDPISQAGKQYRMSGATTTLFTGHGRFAAPNRIAVDGTADSFTADQIVIAAGGHAVIPPEVRDSGLPFHTSDTVMRIDKLPQRLVILGGGFIAAEFAHVFSSFGVAVTVVSRGEMLLRHLDHEIASAFTDEVSRQWDVRLGATVERVSGVPDEIRLELSDGSSVEGDLLLVATGRRPNTADLGLSAAGIEAHPDGRIVVDAYGRTTAAGVWALGDVSSPFQLKHVANHEARVVAHNVAHPDSLRAFDYRFVPSAVFTHPQIATVGITEEEARLQGIEYLTATQSYGETAYGWAMEDTTGICKLIADPQSGLLLGAHLMGYQSSNLIQPLIQAMSFGQRVADVATGQYWIHPALAEVVENALLKLGLS